MDLGSIGRNIRKFRMEQKMRQDDLAERAGLSTNYVGAIERGVKVPSLETLIDIINVLDVSADMVLSDVLQTGCRVRASELSEKLEKLPADDQTMICDVLEVMIRHSEQNSK